MSKKTNKLRQIYYFGGKFNPFTRGHLKAVEMLLKTAIASDFDPRADKIVIGLTDIPKGTGCDGHHLCSDFEYRYDMVRAGIRDLLVKYGFSLNEEKSPILISCQGSAPTYEYITGELMTALDCRWDDAEVTLVLGEDEVKGLHMSSSKAPTTTSENYIPWKHADEILSNTKHIRIFEIPRPDAISSTEVRSIFHSDPYTGYYQVKNLIQKEVFDEIKLNHHYWQYGTEAQYQAEENKFIAEYDVTKYPRPSATVGAILFTGFKGEEKILLVRRKANPYKGFWALPGGFLNISDDETLEEAVAREVLEETSLDYTFTRENQFRTYSDRGSDPRCRVVDTIYAKLVEESDARFARAADDACEVCWFPIRELPRMAFNHETVISDFVESDKFASIVSATNVS